MRGYNPQEAPPPPERDAPRKPRKLYRVLWDNGHASDVFSEKFTSRRAAEKHGAAWKRMMVSYETTPKARAEARHQYQWEVVEDKPED